GAQRLSAGRAAASKGLSQHAAAVLQRQVLVGGHAEGAVGGGGNAAVAERHGAGIAGADTDATGGAAAGLGTAVYPDVAAGGVGARAIAGGNSDGAGAQAAAASGIAGT